MLLQMSTGHFNVLGEYSDRNREFWSLLKLRKFGKGFTYFKNVNEPISIHHILNDPMCFDLFETSLSDFHKLTFTCLKMY